MEDTLIKDKRFHLPGRKALVGSDIEYAVVLIDASETAVERPKKDSGVTTRARRQEEAALCVNSLFLNCRVSFSGYGSPREVYGGESAYIGERLHLPSVCKMSNPSLVARQLL